VGKNKKERAKRALVLKTVYPKTYHFVGSGAKQNGLKEGANVKGGEIHGGSGARETNTKKTNRKRKGSYTGGGGGLENIKGRQNPLPLRKAPEGVEGRGPGTQLKGRKHRGTVKK